MTEFEQGKPGAVGPNTSIINDADSNNDVTVEMSH